jgi:hypothetical protein
MTEPDKEQSPSVTELVRLLAEDGQLGGSTDAPPELMALAQLVLCLAEKVAARPTPDLEGDEELVERIKRKVVNARGVEVNEDTPEEERDRLYVVRRSRQRR